MPVENARSEAQGPSTEFASYTCWRFSAQKLQVFIHPALYRATANAALLASKGKRPAEIGGLLLGRVIPGKELQSIVVNEVQGVPGEARLFNATAKDSVALQTALKRLAGSAELQPVGYFRSDIREDAAVSNEDWDFFARHVETGPALFLVMRPEGNARCLPQFYIWNKDRRLELAIEESSAQPAFAAPVAQNGPESIAHSSELLSSSRNPHLPSHHDGTSGEDSVWTRGNLAAIALLVIACFAGFLSRPYIQNHMHGAAAEQGAPTTTLIGLHVERGAGGELNLSWNRNLPGLSSSQTANLTILDGPFRRTIAIDPQQLHFGRVTYFPQSDDVQFQLEIYLGDDRSLSENLHVVGSGYGKLGSGLAGQNNFSKDERLGLPGRDWPRNNKQPEAAQRVNGSVLNAGSSAKPLRLESAEASSTPNASAIAPSINAIPASTSPATFDAIKQPNIAWNAGSQTFEIQNRLPVEAPPPIANTLPAPAAKEPSRTAPTRIPARPLRQVLPDTKLFGRSLIRDEVTLEVAVVIDANGRVTTARALNPKSVGSFLAAQAVTAAKQWTFEPAQIGDESVPSTYTILFRFHP